MSWTEKVGKLTSLAIKHQKEIAALATLASAATSLIKLIKSSNEATVSVNIEVR